MEKFTPRKSARFTPYKCKTTTLGSPQIAIWWSTLKKAHPSSSKRYIVGGTSSGRIIWTIRASTGSGLERLIPLRMHQTPKQIMTTSRVVLHAYLSPRSCFKIYSKTQMEKRKIIYQIVALLAAAGVIVSYLLAPSKTSEIAFEPTIYTGLCGLILFCAEGLWVRETARLNGQKLNVKWALITLTLLIISVAPQAFCLTLGAYFWFALLPMFAILIIFRLFKLAALNEQKDLRK
jgi:hypothetical protein